MTDSVMIKSILLMISDLDSESFGLQKVQGKENIKLESYRSMVKMEFLILMVLLFVDFSL